MSDNTREAFERHYAYIPAITPTKETAWRAWTASRLQAIEEAAKVCDEQAQRSTECSEKATRVLTKDLYRNTAFGAKFCASAIRNLTQSEDGKA